MSDFTDGYLVKDRLIKTQSEEIEKLKAKNTELKNLILEQDHKLQKIVSSAGIEKIEIFPNGEKIIRLTRQVEILKKALEFYADGTNYESVYEDDEMDLHRLIDREDVCFDGDALYFGHAGKRARQALKECEGIE